MNRITSIILLVFLCVVLFSCKDKKQDDVIITKKAAPQKVQTGTLSMSDYDWSKAVDWVGNRYTIVIKRSSDKALPLATDESGRKYYDNRISLKVIRTDGSVFFERVFTKEDFSNFTDNAYGKHGALLGIVFDRAETDHLVFAASVGSPDTMSDEYIPLVMTVSRFGDVSIKNDTQLDTGNGEPRDELEAAEAEGM